MYRDAANVNAIDLAVRGSVRQATPIIYCSTSHTEIGHIREYIGTIYSVHIVAGMFVLGSLE